MSESGHAAGASLGEDPTRWTKPDLQALIDNQVEESLTLDYKASGSLGKTDAKKSEISKDVSSFANSAGGVIIYGIEESGQLPARFDGVNRHEFSREWLEQVVNSRIQRRVPGVRIVTVSLDEPLVAYVVSIPQSQLAPHMASDGRYYKRFELQSVRMEEYEVRDVANRSVAPDLRIELVAPPPSFVANFEEPGDVSTQVNLQAAIVNRSPTPAEYAVIKLVVDRRLQSQLPNLTRKDPVYAHVPELGKVELDYWQVNWGVPGKLPIWQGINFSLLAQPGSIRVPRGEAEYWIAWTVAAPHMTTRSESLVVRTDGQGVVTTTVTKHAISL